MWECTIRIKLISFSGSAGEGGEEVYVLREDPDQDLRDERSRHQAETGVD